MIFREGLHRKLTFDLYIQGGVGVCQIEKMERKNGPIKEEITESFKADLLLFFSQSIRS